jgi:hypothetical protein
VTVVADRDVVLLYSATCPRCRLASRAVLALGLGRLRRVAIGTPEADHLYERTGQRPGRLGIVRGDTFYGALRIPLGIVAAWGDEIQRALSRRGAQAR